MITLPTIDEIYQNAITELEAEFEATITEDGKSELRAQAATIAALLKQFYFTIGQLQQNVWPDSSDEQTLLRFGQVILQRKPFSATPAIYKCEVTGGSGEIIPANTVFRSDDDSLNPAILYKTTADYTMPSTTGEIEVTCMISGTDGKQSIGDTMTITSPLPLINGSIEITEEVESPLAAESIEDYREKVLQRMQYNLFPGSATFYRLCAEDVQGIRTVYPFARTGYAGETNLYVEAELSDSTDGKGTPTTQILDDYEQACEINPDTSLPINYRGRRIVDSVLNILPITVKEIAITVTGYQGLTPTIESQIESAIEEWLYGVRPFVAGADALSSKNDIINNILLANEIGKAKPNSIFTSITFTVDAVSYSSYQMLLGNIPHLNSITFA